MVRTLFNLDPTEQILDVEIYLRHHWIWAILLLIGAIVFSIYMYRSETELTEARRKVMSVCQAIGALLIIIMLVQPVMRMEIERPLRKTLLVLTDTSTSMGIQDERKEVEDIEEAAKALRKRPLTEQVMKDTALSMAKEISGATRLDLAKAALTHPEIDLAGKLGESYQFRYFSFDDNLEPVAGEGETTNWLNEAEADGEISRVGTAIEEAVARHTGQPIGGVIVLSDFTWIKGRDPSDVARNLKERDIPVYTVPIGLEEPPDVHVRKLIAPEVVFTGDDVPLRVQIDSHGFAGRTVELSLSVDDDVVVEQSFELAGGSQFEEMMFAPRRKGGEALLKVAVADVGGETTLENNSIDHEVEILDEKIKVLYIEGSPRWEYRYLRWVLLRDQRLDVKFLMTEGDPALANASPFYIQKFPEAPEDLLQQDLVIIGDVPASKFTPAHMTMLEKLVKEHGLWGTNCAVFRAFHRERLCKCGS
ncbi:MAG: hypothetical protein AAF492_16545, partial [Verrucomicrobiota bacterium]